MGLRGINMGLVLVLVAMLWARATAQSGCTSVLISMAPFLNHVTGSASTPSSSCCLQLASVVQSQPQCLCAALNDGGASLGININQTLALALPGACNVQTPPVSRCNATNGPVMSPYGSPASSPESSPGDSSNTPTVSSTTGRSKTIPATGGSSSNGHQINIPLQLVLFAFFVASCASTFSSF